ncbi:hypothetical protein JCM9279_000582 [Rhodotorula babjevae]
MSAVEDCTIPKDPIEPHRYASPSKTGLALVLKHLIHTRRADNGVYVFMNRYALGKWRAEQEKELKEDWAAPSAHRELFAKAMVWWNERLQRGDLSVEQMPPTSVLKGWLAGDTSMERHWHEASKRWDTLRFDPVRGSYTALSLSKAPRAQLGLRAAQIYGLDGRDWEARNAARRD